MSLASSGQRKQTRTRPEVDQAGLLVDAVRRAGRVDRRDWHTNLTPVRRPLLFAIDEALNARVQVIDLIHGVELLQAPLRVSANPFEIAVRELRPQQPRRLTIAAFRERRCC